MSEIKKLEVGSVVYCDYRGKLECAYTIGRVTKTKAVSGNIEFNREYAHNHASKKNRPRWDLNVYPVETEELKEKWRRKLLIDNIDLIGIDKLPTNELELILSKLKKQTK